MFLEIMFFIHWGVLFLNQNFGNFIHFFLIFFLIFGLSIGVGFFVMRYAYPCHELFKWEMILGSFLVGFVCLGLIFYAAFCCHISPKWLIILLVCAPSICILLFRKQDYVEWQWKQKYLVLVIFFLVLFGYYSILPLTTQYGFTRDYDLTSLGILNTGNFVLPPYDIESYYPPLVSVIGAYITSIYIFIVPTDATINTNIIMISIFSIGMMLIFVSAYFLGYTWTGKRTTGFLSMLALAFISCSRNAVVGGSTYPALLANLYFFCLLIFGLLLIRRSSLVLTIMAGLCVAGVFLSHLDIFFSALWFFVAVGVTFLIWYRKQRKWYFLLLMLFIIAGTFMFPYLKYGLENKGKFNEIWTEEKWVEKAKGESHPKTFSEVIFFVGKPAVGFVFLSLLFCCINIWKRSNSLQLSFLFCFWFLCMALQNSWLMLLLSKKVIHIYPLNIIMWMGLVVFITCLGTFALEQVSIKITNKKIFFSILLLFLCIVVADYETFNILNTYRPGAGFLWQAIAEKNVVISSGDILILHALAAEQENKVIFVPDTYAGYYSIVATGKNSTLSFYEAESYHDPSFKLFFEELINKTIFFFNNPLANESNEFLTEKNISYIFLPAEQGADGLNVNSLTYNSSLFNGNYKVIMRANGAKLLQQSEGNFSFIHREAESVFNVTKTYFYPKSIYRVSVPLSHSDPLIFPFANNICFKKGYLLVLTSPFPLDLHIVTNTQDLNLTIQSAKFQFSEIPFEFNNAVCGPITILASGYYSTEIDWLELE
jgi:hypothetical protein